MKKVCGILLVLVLAAGIASLPRAVWAHESQTVGPKAEYLLVVGWKYEPAFTDVMNAASVTIHRAADGRAINTNMGDVVDLELEIQFRAGSPKDHHEAKVVESAPLGKVRLEPLKENVYNAWVKPSSAGVYAFRVKGTIDDKSDPKTGPVAIDATFICGESAPGHHDHFACLQDPPAFPSKGAAAKAAQSKGKEHSHSHGNGEHEHKH